MSWDVLFDERFAMEIKDWPEEAYTELTAKAGMLRQFGPALKRPTADTLTGSKHANMKELQFNAADGVWRVAFAFDPERQAVLLVGGDKSGTSSRRFYKALIRRADERFDAYLNALREKRGQS